MFVLSDLWIGCLLVSITGEGVGTYVFPLIRRNVYFFSDCIQVRPEIMPCLDFLVFFSYSVSHSVWPQVK